MTKQESIQKMAELRAEVEILIGDYNEAFQNGKYEEAQKADADMTEKVNEYTGIARNMCFDECIETGDPMKEAVTRLTYGTIKTKDEKKDDDALPVRTLIEVDKQIDLLKLHKYAGHIGADKNWTNIAQKMNFCLTLRKATELGIDVKEINDSYDMTALAREYDMGKNPVSNTKLLATLQTVIAAMLGEGYKATSHDVNYLMSVYSKKGKKALTVSCANHRYFVGYLADICHHIVTGEVYSIDYKVKKAS